MFGFGKKKQAIDVFAPVTGTVIPLSEVPDPAFAGGSMGYGFAVQPTSSTVTSPVAGEIIMLFPTAHAFAVRTPGGAEVLVHIGVDTVTLKGEGFRALAAQGDVVEAGAPVVGFDLNIANDERVKSTDVLVVVTNGRFYTPSEVQVGSTTNTPVLTLTKN